MTFEEQFEAEFAPRLAHRAAGFRSIFARVIHRSAPIIVETGCLRELGNWTGDGQSTILFDAFVKDRGAGFCSVDISAEAVAIARSAVSSPVHHGDSVKFLESFRIGIDLLYLDSLDFDGARPLVSATHHLFELCAANRWLKHGAIVAVDDMSKRDSKPFGKGMLVADYMKRIGAELFLDDYQMAWAMP